MFKREFEKFQNDFLGNSYHLSTCKTAAFCAGTSSIAFVIGGVLEWGLLTAALVISAQCVTSINRQGPFHIRLGIALKAAVIISALSLVGSFAGAQSLPVKIICGVVLAFSIGWCRQLFPLNWANIAIPAGALFFMNMLMDAALVTFYGTLLGVVCEFLLGIFIYLKRYRFASSPAPKEEEILPPEDKSDRIILGLKGYLWTYSLELGLLMAIGFVMMQFTDYPHAYWIPFTGILVLKIGRRETIKCVIERSLGTLAGCVFGCLSLYLFHSIPLAITIITVVCIFFKTLFLPRNYAAGTFFITAYVLLLFCTPDPFPLAFALERIAFTITGGLLAIIVSLVFLKKERL